MKRFLRVLGGTALGVLAALALGLSVALGLLYLYYPLVGEDSTFARTLAASGFAALVVLGACASMVWIAGRVSSRVSRRKIPAMVCAGLLSGMLLVWSWYIVELVNHCGPGYEVFTTNFGRETRCPFS